MRGEGRGMVGVRRKLCSSEGVMREGVRHGGRAKKVMQYI